MCIRRVKINVIAKGAVEMAGEKNDFSKGSIVGNIVNLAIPMLLTMRDIHERRCRIQQKIF